jgi:hypothetical protein
MQTPELIITLTKGPDKNWQPAPRPNNEEAVFVKALSTPEGTYHLDQTTHLINKITLGKEYVWCRAKNATNS